MAFDTAIQLPGHTINLIGLREKLQEHPILHGKIYGFRFRFSLSCQPIDTRDVSFVTSQGRGGGEKLKKQFEALAEGTGIEVPGSAWLG